ncbi:MAG: aminotransferase class V-fold PLP-dependent enzyme, partial [Balneolales bacterium]|nr:aminotransferase class V-fold PLP-dependent enzyme [Balneolales bacterium]
MKPEFLPDEVLNTYRQEFPHLDQPHYYLNHAAFGVLSNRVNNSINEHLRERNRGVIESFMIDSDIIEQARKKIAKLINAPSSDQIAFVTNTSEGINLIAAGLNWSPGDSVLLNDAEFPSNVYPYQNLRARGVNVRFAPAINGKITSEDLVNAMHDTDRLVGVSAVQFLSGYRINLKELGEVCADQNKWLIVDGIQAMGNSPVDVQDMQIHGLVSGGLKWLM